MSIALVHDPSDREREERIGICLSGGGYRAMLFHLGSLWRLHQSGLLANAARVSSVSGGSIVAAKLALEWNRLDDDPGEDSQFARRVVVPLRALASKSIDVASIAGGVLLPGVSISDRVISKYESYLFGPATLQDLPTAPQFVFNATSLQSGVLCRFSKPYVWDYRVGKIENPTLSIAEVVAASSAFPPVLSPCTIDVDPDDFVPDSGTDLGSAEFRSELVLTDGGVYDNLGLETVWKRYNTVFVSDGGGQMMPEEEPEIDWVRQSKRVLDVVDNQVRSLRKRQVISSFKNNDRSGAYWGIRTDLANYRASGSPTPFDAPHARTMKLANIPTRLKKLPRAIQERLINWGYAVTSAALVAHYDPDIGHGELPYPDRRM